MGWDGDGMGMGMGWGWDGDGMGMGWDAHLGSAPQRHPFLEADDEVVPSSGGERHATEGATLRRKLPTCNGHVKTRNGHVTAM